MQTLYLCGERERGEGGSAPPVRTIDHMGINCDAVISAVGVPSPLITRAGQSQDDESYGGFPLDLTGIAQSMASGGLAAGDKLSLQPVS